MALHNGEAFNILGFEHKGAEVVGSRRFSVDGVNKHEAPVVSDRVGRQNLRRKKPRI
jgi:hypothetical protein